MIRPCRRRQVLAAAGGLLAASRRGVGRARAAAPMRLLVAGVPGGRTARWAAALALALQRAWPGGLQGGAAPDIVMLGGEDGVTGANQFEARGPSDGAALLLPGAAASAWLAGDPRVQFDAARWLPVMCAVSGGVLAGRRTLADARPAWPMRLAVAEPLGPGAACLLGLDLLGVPARPVAQEAGDAAEGQAALLSGQADAAFLSGQNPIAAAEAAGALPLCTLGTPGAPAEAAAPAAAAAPPTMPALLSSVISRDPALVAGWSAVAASVQLDYALVLPPLTDAASVALWREAADRAVDDPALLAAADPGARALATAGSGAVLGAIATTSAALLAYRRWLASRLGYQPG